MADIFIVRHGHSPMTGPSDHQRSLSLEGRMAAHKTGQFIQQQQLEDCICICSDATRTQQTAEIICEIMGIKTCDAHHALYGATVGMWHEIMLAHPNKNQILVGHNPTMSQLYTQLTNQHKHFSPACVGHIRIEILQDGLTLPAENINFYNPDNH
ncbi:SixA phosphatase family protein [Marinicella sp. W31]|uniref:SixA phosphatase family protein n=1 Tax=Marinicella sp. W31 TaxID=3023713 RepID=UPI0037583CFE